MTANQNQHEVTQIDIRLIVPGDNDRTIFDQTHIIELAENIAANGLIQPITVREIDGGSDPLYQIVAGERRFRAIETLEWGEVPAIIKDLTEEEASAVMLAENIGRRDSIRLTPPTLTRRE